ncbi:hypothetical protein GQ53DRAFT_236330 [Thozetella sp. PMI_491]|nr:hypothetical protein GQ53DRAFT_236330 [Thozetella sp. PMI_491]
MKGKRGARVQDCKANRENLRPRIGLGRSYMVTWHRDELYAQVGLRPLPESPIRYRSLGSYGWVWTEGITRRLPMIFAVYIYFNAPCLGIFCLHVVRPSHQRDCLWTPRRTVLAMTAAAPTCRNQAEGPCWLGLLMLLWILRFLHDAEQTLGRRSLLTMAVSGWARRRARHGHARRAATSTEHVCPYVACNPRIGGHKLGAETQPRSHRVAPSEQSIL